MGQGRVLFVCTGNQCRSPMAEVLLRHHLGPDSPIEVASAGTVGDGTPPPPNAVEAMAEIGLDIAGRTSRPLTRGEIESSDLIIGMARDHLVQSAELYPPAFERIFTFTELLDRARMASPRGASETVEDWAFRLGAGRSRQSVLALPSSGDVPDPMGHPYTAFERTRAQLEQMTSVLAAYLTGAVPPSQPQNGSAPRRRWFRR